MDELIQKLKRLNIGCYFFDVFAAALFYADDMAILAPSVRALQILLNVCEAYCSEWDICLNAKKTKNLYFGKPITTLCKLSLNGKEIEWVEEWSYLGVVLKSGKTFGCSVSDRIKKFYRCSNSIFRIDGRSNDLVMLQLIETHCVPLLTFGVEIVHIVDRNKYFPTVGLRVCQRYSIFSAGQLGRNLLKRESVAFSKDLDNVLLTPCLGQPSHDITYNLNH